MKKRPLISNELRKILAEDKIPVFPPKSCNALNLNDLAEQTEINGTVPGHNFLTLYNTLAELSKEKKCFSLNPSLTWIMFPQGSQRGKFGTFRFTPKILILKC